MKVKYINYYLLIFLSFFLTTNVIANNKYFKCPEKILNVTKGSSTLMSPGSIYGTNYVKFHINESVSIKFKYSNSEEKPYEIINNQKLTKNLLGYEIYHRISDSKKKIENNYNFIKLDNTYVFTRNVNSWYLANENNNKNYEYESSGRCIEINKNEFLKGSFKKIVKKKTTVDNNKKEISKRITGERIFALSWQGIDELMIGKLYFDEENFIGKLQFDLNDGKNKCIGTYVLSASKGTWSILCDKKDMNASGFLTWNSKNGNIAGNGKDSKGKIVKFKVSK